MLELVLGTAQFGLKYGINNNEDIFSFKKVKKILDICRKNNINILDTAYAYGKSEKLLGEYQEINQFEICSKLPSADYRENQKIDEIINISLNNLNIDTIDYYFLHDISDVYNKKVIDELAKLKDEGIIKKLGVSIYEPEEVTFVIDNVIFDIIQLPLNLFDRRFINKNKLEILEKNNIDIFIRSIFLQGLFFMEKDNLPEKLDSASDYFKKIYDFINDYDYNIIDFIFSWYKYNDFGNYILIGIDNEEQLKNNISSFNKQIPNFIMKKFNNLVESIEIDENSIIIDPRKW